MFARVTAFEIDTMRIPLADAEKLFADEVVPAMRNQHGFAGFMVMRTPEGKGLVVTLWDSEETATASVESGHYGQQIARFVAFMRQAPGRDFYEVVLAEMPAHTAVAV